MFAFCEDTFCGLGSPIVVVHYDANQGTLVSYIYAPGLSSVPKSGGILDSFIKSGKFYVNSLQPSMSRQLVWPSIGTFIHQGEIVFYIYTPGISLILKSGSLEPYAKTGQFEFEFAESSIETFVKSAKIEIEDSE